MILMHGEMISSEMESKYLEGLYENCIRTLSYPSNITTQKVINACDILYKRVMSGEFWELILPVLQMSDISRERFLDMARLFSREELEYKCKIEFGELSEKLKSGILRKRYPLGILFHIAAGNVDGLPAYSVIEGLLAGNINILKLPAGDNGLSVRLLYELVKCEPDLKDYIYVFDVPSTDKGSLREFARIADAVVVWGGDEAVKAARELADVTTKIIPWGHKLSFAYVSERVTDMQLEELAKHVCLTNQVLCSSCQGIYVDTESPEVLEEIGRRFYVLLQKVNRELGRADMGMRGKNTIRLYADMLERDIRQKTLHGDGVSVVIKEDGELELSYLFRNVWVKALPRQEIIPMLKKHKNHLQTCGLLCSDEEKEELQELLLRAGIVRLTEGNMSRMVAGEAHDGTYPLLEYSRIVEIG